MAEAANPVPSDGEDHELRRLLDAQRDSRVLVAVAAVTAANAGGVVNDAFDAAVRPDRVRVAVAVPADGASDPALDRWSGDPRVSIERVSERHVADGASVSALRSAARDRYDGEPFVVLVDAPVHFVSGWDEWVIEVLEQADADRPIIDLRANQRDAVLVPPSPTGAARVVRPRLVDVVAPGRLCVETPNDAEDHDGSRLALRAYTCGYDCFAVDNVLVRSSAPSVADPTESQDGPSPDHVGELGERRTVDAFRRLLAWSQPAGNR